MEKYLSINSETNLICERFSRGEIVFRIEAVSPNVGIEKDVHMVTTKDEYEKKLYTHLYNPILFIVDLPTRLAYLYGCLNLKFRQPQKEIYTFYWREINSNDWKSTQQTK